MRSLRCSCAALFLTVLVIVHGSDKKEPIVIIGGGISGLSAALELQHHHGDVVIVEALERLGGRAHSYSPDIELGGTYLHGSNSLIPLIERYKLPTVVSGGGSSHPGMSTARWMYKGRVLDKKNTETRATHLVKEWYHGVGEALMNHTTTTEDTVGLLRNVSSTVMQEMHLNDLERALLDFELTMEFPHDRGALFEEHSVDGMWNGWDFVEYDGPDLVVQSSMSSLIQAMQRQLEARTANSTTTILLNSPVERISYHDNMCQVHIISDNNKTSTVLRASACIVTLPLAVLKAQHSTLFDPPLPHGKHDALVRAGVAIFNTLVITWRQPLCHDAGAYYLLNGEDTLNASSNNPLSSGFVCPQVLRNTTRPSHVTQFYIHGDQHPFDNDSYWKLQAVEVLNQVYTTQTFVVDDIVDMYLTKWHEDPRFLGSYSAATTHTRGNVDRRILAEPLSDVVFFAGEHTHTKGRYQSLDGAYDTGIRAAQQVLAATSQPQQDTDCNTRRRPTILSHVLDSDMLNTVRQWWWAHASEYRIH